MQSVPALDAASPAHAAGGSAGVTGAAGHDASSAEQQHAGASRVARELRRVVRRPPLGGRGRREQPDRFPAAAAHRAAVALQRARVARDDVAAGERRVARALHADCTLTHVPPLLRRRERDPDRPPPLLLPLRLHPLHTAAGSFPGVAIQQ